MTELLTLNKPNKNGRTYPTEVVREAIERYYSEHKGHPVYIQQSFDWPSHTVNVEKIVGKVEELIIDEDRLMGNVSVFPGKEDLLNFAVRPSFTAQLSEDGIVSDATLITFAFTPDPA